MTIILKPEASISFLASSTLVPPIVVEVMVGEVEGGGGGNGSGGDGCGGNGGCGGGGSGSGVSILRHERCVAVGNSNLVLVWQFEYL